MSKPKREVSIKITVNEDRSFRCQMPTGDSIACTAKFIKRNIDGWLSHLSNYS